MAEYGKWLAEIRVGGKSISADEIAPEAAERAGLRRIFAVNGLPPEHLDNLARAAQVSDAPHTWRVQECRSEAEVTPEVLAQAKEVITKDESELNAHIITYLGETGTDDHLHFLAAGAIRDKLTRDYQNQAFPVVSRAIVAPAFRERGLGSLIVEHRIEAAMTMFGKTPKGIHFGTESKKILSAVAKVEQKRSLKFVYIGDEEYTAADGTHTVHDYLCFLPEYRTKLVLACDTLRPLAEDPSVADQLKAGLEVFMEKGVEATSGDELERLFAKLAASVTFDHTAGGALNLLGELFTVKKKIGAHDPR